MSTYTPADKAAALQTVATKGYTAASKAHGPSVETLKKWAKAADVTPYDGRRTAKENADRRALEARSTAEAERAARHAQAQEALGRVADQQVSLVTAHQNVSARVAQRLLRALAALDRLDETGGSEQEVRAASAKVDAELARARQASVSFGIHVDKLLALGGENGAMQAGVAASSSSVVNVLLTSDAEFRRTVSETVRERYRALSGDVVEASSTPAG